jgi:hypothetical protein
VISGMFELQVMSAVKFVCWREFGRLRNNSISYPNGGSVAVDRRIEKCKEKGHCEVGAGLYCVATAFDLSPTGHTLKQELQIYFTARCV